MITYNLLHEYLNLSHILQYQMSRDYYQILCNMIGPQDRVLGHQYHPGDRTGE